MLPIWTYMLASFSTRRWGKSSYWATLMAILELRPLSRTAQRRCFAFKKQIQIQLESIDSLMMLQGLLQVMVGTSCSSMNPMGLLILNNLPCFPDSRFFTCQPHRGGVSVVDYVLSSHVLLSFIHHFSATTITFADYALPSFSFQDETPPTLPWLSPTP